MDKASCHQYWKVFEAASDEQLVAFSELGKNPEITSDIVDKIKHYTCRIHQFNTKSSSLSELRWFLFTLKQVNGERLPPTRDSVIPAVKSANFQSLIWEQDERPDPVIPSPHEYGWSIEDGQFVPDKCEIYYEPKSLLGLDKCLCVKKQMSASMSMLVKKLSVHRDVCTKVMKITVTMYFQILENSSNTDRQ